MERIEQEFGTLKEQFFTSQIHSFLEELQLVKEGRHERFVDKVRDLEEKKRDRQHSVDHWKQMQLQNILNEYEAEKKQVEDDFKGDKTLLRDKMIYAIEDRLKRLHEEKLALNLADGNDFRTTTRNLRKRGGKENATVPQLFSAPAKKKIPQSLQISSILLLKEQEIMDDLAAIQKRPIIT